MNKYLVKVTIRREGKRIRYHQEVLCSSMYEAITATRTQIRDELFGGEYVNLDREPPKDIDWETIFIRIDKIPEVK